jgi:hypothetical protein
LSTVQELICDETSERVIRILIGTFGEAWATDPAPASRDPSEVDRVRREYVAPVFAGALRALIQFAWITAPPGSTVDQIQAHMEGNLRALTAIVTPPIPAGDFWTSPLMDDAIAECRKAMN